MLLNHFKWDDIFIWHTWFPLNMQPTNIFCVCQYILQWWNVSYMKKISYFKFFLQLAQQCDILVENYIPGKLNQYNLGYSTMSQAAPHLIYCSISGESGSSISYFDGKYGNLYWHLRAMLPTIYAAKFKQTITHQHMLLRWKSQSYRWSICSIILCLHVLIAHHIFINY